MTTKKPRSTTAAPWPKDAPGHQEPAYEVGRNKPPKHTRFPPGVSGNPGGRKKGSRNFKTILHDFTQSEITVTEQGVQRQVTVLEALLLRQVQDGLRGDLRASNSVLDRMERHLAGEEAPDEDLTAEDSDLLARGLERQAARLQTRPVQYGDKDLDEPEEADGSGQTCKTGQTCGSAEADADE